MELSWKNKNNNTICLRMPELFVYPTKYCIKQRIESYFLHGTLPFFLGAFGGEN